MDFFIARQPIFASNLRVYAYELLYRGQPPASLGEITGDRATTSLLSSAFLTEGIDKISDFKPCFINFTKNLLLREVPLTFSPRQIVVEILEDVPPDPDVLEVCRALRKQGYPLVLDDFIYHQDMEPLLELASIVKIDIRLTPLNTIHRTLSRLERFQVKLLAEKIETREEFDTSIKLGFSYHQGFFFCRPELIRIKELTAVKINLLQLLAELSRNDWSTEELARIITRDTALTYKILKYLNSAYFYRLQEITSVKHAIAFLGEQEIRRFALLAIIAELATDKPAELVRLSIIRARFCELLAEATKQQQHSRDIFVLGLFSVLDAMLDRPMADILEGLPLPAPLAEGLLRQTGDYGSYLQFVMAYEERDRDRCIEVLHSIGTVSGRIHQLYLAALEYADGLTKQ